MRAPNLRPRRRPGNVVVATAVSLVTLLSCVALAVDGGMLMDKRRHAQAAADGAALAAAGQLYYDWVFEKGADPNGTARQAAFNTARENGFETGPNCEVEVFIPPTTGQFVGQKGYAEVRIRHDHGRFFSKVFGTESIAVRARAVARGRKSTTGQAILVLDPDDKAALKLGGNGTSFVSGAPIQVNSAHPEAVFNNGNASLDVTNNSELNITGGLFDGSGGVRGDVVFGTEPIPDPLYYLPTPDRNSMIVRSTKKINHSSANTLTLKPGVYIGGIQITGKGNVILEPGIYYMDGGGFTWGAQGSLTGYEVMIYNHPYSTSDKIDLSGSGTCILTPPSTGTYQGILFFQKRDEAVPINVTGQSNMNITGTFYATGANMTVAGQGTSDLIGSQYIVKTLTTTGNGNFSVNWTPTTTPGIREVALVE
jgi:hypothetical protein